MSVFTQAFCGNPSLFQEPLIVLSSSEHQRSCVIYKVWTFKMVI